MLATIDLERAVQLQAAKAGPGGAVLVLLDADDDCAATLGPALLARVSRPDVRVGVVMAVKMYEAWLAASAASLVGVRGIPTDLTPPHDAEQLTNAKKWIERSMTGAYSETVDQPALTARMDVEAASIGCSSFRKLLRELSRLLEVDLTSQPQESE